MEDSPTWTPKKPKARPLPEGDITFDSDEELWSFWMFSELVDAGALLSIKRSESIILHDGLKVNAKAVFGKHSYKSDFDLEWDVNSGIYELLTKPKVGLPVFHANGSKSLIEVKPCFDAHGKTALATINAKWVYEKTGLIVQVIKIGTAANSFFASTWTPYRFQLTATGKPRSLKFQPRSLAEFVSTLS